MRRLLSVFVALAAWVAPNALASEIVSDRNVTNPTLKVNKRGHALVQYTREDGTRRNVVFWNAINAVANSDVALTQVKFKIDYAGGWGAFRKANYWKKFRNVCKRYDGPTLVGFVAGCKAPDGSYWALQNWVRLEAMRGFAPFRKAHTDVEVHISHWRGPLPVLEGGGTGPTAAGCRDSSGVSRTTANRSTARARRHGRWPIHLHAMCTSIPLTPSTDAGGSGTPR